MKAKARLAIACAVVFAALGVLLGRGYQVLCAGPVATYPAIAALRDQAAGEASAAPAASPPAVGAGMKAEALTVLLTVKQSDYVSFPAHLVAALSLEVGGCPPRSSGDQWRKAAGHAWTGWTAQLAVGGLRRTLERTDGFAGTVAELRSYAADEPWHAANLRRVMSAYEAS